MSSNTDWLSAPRISRILILLLFLGLPHLLKMPLWGAGAVLLLGIWRLVISRQGLRNPPTFIRLGLAAGLCAGLIMHYRSFSGLEAGSALLCLMTALKLLETRTRRDCRLLLYLGFVLLLSQLLRTQDIQWLLWLIVGFVLNCAALIDLQHPQSLLPARRNLRQSAGLALKALPMAAVLFVLFPRIPGPLWGLPQDVSAGRSGLSDTMTPGNISKLALSDEVAFRVRFDDQAPPNRDLYWRGPVLTRFDGAEWKQIPRVSRYKPAQLTHTGPTTRYEIQLEPHGRRYLLALDMPVGRMPNGTQLNYDYILSTRDAVMDARLLKLESASEYRLDVEPPRLRMLEYTRLPGPERINPRTRALAESWRAQANNLADIPRAALFHFRTETFSYTLEPPLLVGQDRIDQFLFESRAGFCEHYAAAFVVLMRFAGLPARVVTGYQGAESNGDYHIVRQSDAHAWAEVWLPQRGWIRVDPTGAVAPERIELGLAAALRGSSLLPSLARGGNLGRDWWAQAELAWDRVDAGWNRWVLAFGPELQRDILSKFGLGELREMLQALIALAALCGLIVAAQVGWRHRFRPEVDALQRLRRDLLRKAGLELPAHRLGPQHIETALRDQRLWGPAIERILAHYTRLRYALPSAPDNGQIQRLEKALDAWKPRG